MDAIDSRSGQLRSYAENDVINGTIPSFCSTEYI